MKTDELVSLLAADHRTVARGVPSRRLAWAVLSGLAGAAVLMAATIGVNPDIGAVISLPMFWIRLALALCLACAALLLTARLSVPGVAPGKAWIGVAAPVLAAWFAAIVLVSTANPVARLPLLLGHSWRICPFIIAALSIPGFITVFWAIKGLAPTRLRLSGATGGLLAGALGAIAYCLHCPEMAVSFWSVWYLLGMVIPTVAGALLGPRLLRW
jgi:hypothetical protein